jgi:hypothetical protein
MRFLLLATVVTALYGGAMLLEKTLWSGFNVYCERVKE